MYNVQCIANRRSLSLPLLNSLAFFDIRHTHCFLLPFDPLANPLHSRLSPSSEISSSSSSSSTHQEPGPSGPPTWRRTCRGGGRRGRGSLSSRKKGPSQYIRSVCLSFIHSFIRCSCFARAFACLGGQAGLRRVVSCRVQEKRGGESFLPTSKRGPGLR